MSVGVSLVILSGGRASRLNGVDKGLFVFNHKPLIAYVITALKNQVSDVVISANRYLDQYSQFGYKVVDDGNKEFEGPLKGLSVALPYCQQEWVLVTTCDMPFLPNDLLNYFDLMGRTEIQVIAVKGRMQLCFLMRKEIAPSLESYLEKGGSRVMQWISSCQYQVIDYPGNMDHFKNFNSLEDFN